MGLILNDINHLKTKLIIAVTWIMEVLPFRIINMPTRDIETLALIALAYLK
jgi:hypothetical protein